MRRLYRAERRRERREERVLAGLGKERDQLAWSDGSRVLGEIVTPADPDGRGLRVRVVVERPDGSLAIVRPGRLEREFF